MEGSTAIKQGEDKGEHKDIRRVDPPAGDAEPKLPVPESVEKAASGATLDPNEHIDALTWLLADEEDDLGDVTVTWDLNIGNGRWVPWTIGPVDTEILKAVRKSSATGNRRMRRAGIEGQVDPDDVSVKIVAYGTVAPDLGEVIAAKGLSSMDPIDAAVKVLRHRFRNKPGLLDQLSGEILALSGYDDDDLRESKEGRTAKNS